MATARSLVILEKSTVAIQNLFNVLATAESVIFSSVGNFVPIRLGVGTTVHDDVITESKCRNTCRSSSKTHCEVCRFKRKL